MKMNTSHDRDNALRVLALCAALLAPSVGMAGGAQDRAADISRGAQTWVNNCARCHNPRDPKEFRDDLWKPITYHMRVRAGLTGQQTRDVLKFLQQSN